MEIKEQFEINTFISILKNYVKRKDKTFQGNIDNDYLQNYKSTLINKTELTLKYCFSLLQNIIIKEKDLYEDNNLLITSTKYKILSLIQRALTESLTFFDFCKNLMSISKEIKCIFKISNLISKIFKIEFLYNYDYLCFFLFEKNFQNGLDLLNGMDKICGLPPFPEEYNFENFLENIKNNYNDYENEEECYIKVFKNNDAKLIDEYIHKIKERKGKYEENKDIIIQIEKKESPDEDKKVENKKEENKQNNDDKNIGNNHESNKNKKKKRKKK